ncbi:hypothetical protein [Limnoglobus roseus]|uniref:Uncharacterized protein n=1 Tax=Limnoglobus roseus TaxID=2598579 RepID=A0A5C1A7K9_9BACT|nr:hypothetical protein [Limnoglobus roseus]QEL15171.1 hypothetical protein PX52LOC_02081 [Limnoglobus roseus]
MVATTENGMSFLLAGGVLFVVAGIAMLLRDTRSLAFGPRCRAIGRQIWNGFIRLLPSRKCVKVLLTFVGMYAVTFSGSGLVCYGILRWYASTLPVATEAYEGFGDAMILLWWAGMAFCGCQLIAFVIALVVASRTYDRLFPPAPIQNV